MRHLGWVASALVVGVSLVFLMCFAFAGVSYSEPLVPEYCALRTVGVNTIRLSQASDVGLYFLETNSEFSGILPTRATITRTVNGRPGATVSATVSMEWVTSMCGEVWVLPVTGGDVLAVAFDTSTRLSLGENLIDSTWSVIRGKGFFKCGSVVCPIGISAKTYLPTLFHSVLYQWPCVGSRVNLHGNPDTVDGMFTVSAQSLGSVSVNIPSWQGTCPNIQLAKQLSSFDGFHKIRMSCDSCSGPIYSSTAYNIVMNQAPSVVTGQFVLYVPDARYSEFVGRSDLAGVTLRKFSQVSDWSFDAMLGASPTDTDAQWVGEFHFGGDYQGTRNRQLFIPMNKGLVTPTTSVFVAWKELQ